MKVFGLEIRVPRSEIRVYNGARPLNEGEMQAAMAVPEDQLQWRATLQLIDQLEKRANRDAQTTVASPGISASCIGGAEWLGRFRSELMEMRAGGLSGRMSNVQRRTSNVE